MVITNQVMHTTYETSYFSSMLCACSCLSLSLSVFKSTITLWLSWFTKKIHILYAIFGWHVFLRLLIIQCMFEYVPFSLLVSVCLFTSLNMSFFIFRANCTHWLQHMFRTLSDMYPFFVHFVFQHTNCLIQITCTRKLQEKHQFTAKKRIYFYWHTQSEEII